MADIGTDHALLPVALIESGRVERAVAADVGDGPLTHAAQTVARHGLGKGITLRRANGLFAIRPGEVECVVIAGMGPQRIVEILGARPEVLGGLQTLVLQPNHGGEQVRRWVAANGWYLADERLVEDRGHYYVAMQCVRGARGPEQPWSSEQWVFGPHILAAGGPILVRLLAHEQARAAKVLGHLQGAGRAGEVEAQRARIAWLDRVRAQVEGRGLQVDPPSE